MARDSLFVRTNAPLYEVSSPFCSPEDLKLAQAFTDVLLTEGPSFRVNSLSTLGEKFEAAQVGNEFTAWANGDVGAVISTHQLRQAIGDLFPVVCERAAIGTPDACLRRLTYVVPTLVKELAPVEPELKDSPRAFRFNLNELRKRLR